MRRFALASLTWLAGCGGGEDTSPCNMAVRVDGLTVVPELPTSITSIVGSGACVSNALCLGTDAFAPGCTRYRVRPVGAGTCRLLVTTADGRSLAFERQVEVLHGTCGDSVSARASADREILVPRP